MEKMTRELFRDPEIEGQKDWKAGLCATGLFSQCRVSLAPPDWSFDAPP